jgi:hydrogenase/urease accessory protein HupE
VRSAIAFDGDSAGPAIPEVAVELDDSDALHLRLALAAPASAQVQVRVPLVARLALGHRQYLQVRDNRGRLVAEQILQADTPGFAVALDSAAAAGHRHSFHAFFALGVEHIATGYDHLLFLLALLIVGPGLRSAAAIITSFTAAHSVTLAMATLGVVHLPPAIVEPLIACSVLYIGVENLYGRRWAPRWMLTFAFGLVHGLGFATVLRDLGVGATGEGAVAPLLAFNVGVEAGQLTLAAVVLPLLWRAQRQPRVFIRVTTAGSMLVALAGAAWLIQRTLMA